MRKSIKLAVVAALALGTTSAFATNGDQMMALGGKSTGMGGVGIATAFGAQSALANAALIKGNEVTFGGTVFQPAVELSNQSNMASYMLNGLTGGMQGNPNAIPFDPTIPAHNYKESHSNLNMIPSVGFVQDISDKVTWGLGMFGTAGMGTDYRDDMAITAGDMNQMLSAATGMNIDLNNFGVADSSYMGTMYGTYQMSTALQIMKFALPVAYRPTANLSIGVAPVIQYGALAISYNHDNSSTGPGASDDIGFGYELGAAYETNGLTVGLVYKSAIEMKYQHQIASAMRNFGVNGGNIPDTMDILEQPAEYGIGLSYTAGGHTLAVDYKNIGWEDAQGYDAFGWESQDVIAVGYQYKQDGKFAVRLGYNKANNPISDQGGATNYDAAVTNFFNIAGFPAIVEEHYTVGASYCVNKSVNIDLAYVYSPELTQTLDTSAMTQAQAMGMLAGAGVTQEMVAPLASEVSVNHSQSALTIAVNVGF